MFIPVFALNKRSSVYQEADFATDFSGTYLDRHWYWEPHPGYSIKQQCSRYTNTYLISVEYNITYACNIMQSYRTCLRRTYDVTYQFIAQELELIPMTSSSMYNYTAKFLFHQSLHCTVTTFWLDSDSVVIVVNCRHHGDYIGIWQLGHRAAGS